MSCFLPGTQIDIGKKNYGQIDIAESVMDNIFQTGGLMLSQVIAMTSLEGYTACLPMKAMTLSTTHGFIIIT